MIFPVTVTGDTSPYPTVVHGHDGPVHASRNRVKTRIERLVIGVDPTFDEVHRRTNDYDRDYHKR